MGADVDVDNENKNKNKTVLYLVRHGTTDYNADLKYQGLADIPLNELGRKQGELLTLYFKDIKIDIGFTSNLMRAKQTLEYILGARSANQGGNIPVIIEPELHEINLGIFETRPVAEVSVLFPAFQDDFIWRPGSLKVPRGESSVQVYNRMRDAILRIVKANQGKVIAMASHGFAIQTWLNYASGIPVENMREWTLDNVAVSKFTFIFKSDLSDLNESEFNNNLNNNIFNNNNFNIFNIKVDFIGDSSHLRAEYRRNYDWEELANPAPLLLYRRDRYRDLLALNFIKRLKNKYKIRFQARDLVAAPLFDEEIDAIAAKFNKINKISAKNIENIKNNIKNNVILTSKTRAVTGFRKSAFKEIFNL